MGSADVLQCFDHVSIPLALESMLALGLPRPLVYAMLAPLEGNQCKMTFAGVCWDDWVSWDKAIRTGGVESPFLFKVVSIYIWEKVVRRWEEQEMGYVLETPLRRVPTRITHALWADNL